LFLTDFHGFIHPLFTLDDGSAPGCTTVHVDHESVLVCMRAHLHHDSALYIMYQEGVLGS